MPIRAMRPGELGLGMVAIFREPPTRAMVRGAVDGLVDDNPYQVNPWTHERKERMVDRIAERPSLASIAFFWDKKLGPETSVYFHWPSDYPDWPRLEWAAGQHVLVLAFQERDLRGDSARRDYLYQRLARAAERMRPWFGVFADMGKQVVPRAGDDLRKVAWPSTLYSQELVESVGRDRFLTLRGAKVQPLDGALLVRASDDPFRAAAATLRGIAKHLGLDHAFAALEDRSIG